MWNFCPRILSCQIFVLKEWKCAGRHRACHFRGHKTESNRKKFYIGSYVCGEEINTLQEIGRKKGLAVALNAAQCLRPRGTGNRGSPQAHLANNAF